jgi:hypothetical protein
MIAWGQEQSSNESDIDDCLTPETGHSAIRVGILNALISKVFIGVLGY